MRNLRLDQTGPAKPGEIHRLTGSGPGLDRHEAAYQVFGHFGNQTEPCFQSKPGLLASYPGPLLSLVHAQVGSLVCCETAPLARCRPQAVSFPDVICRMADSASCCIF